jgi:hypothetical protein
MMDEKLDKKLTPIYRKLDDVKTKLDVDSVETRLDGVEFRLTKLEMDNENIIIPNNQKLAEGYVPLYEKVLQQGVTLVL